MILLVNSQRLALLALAAALIVPGGCNRSRAVTVTGTVQKNGQPLAVSNTGVLQVTLAPEAAADGNFTPRIAECDRATGKFEVRDVLPGKYKIGIEQFDPNPQSDKLNGAFRTDAGKVIREIDGKTPLVIDLAKPGA